MKSILFIIILITVSFELFCQNNSETESLNRFSYKIGINNLLIYSNSSTIKNRLSIGYNIGADYRLSKQDRNYFTIGIDAFSMCQSQKLTTDVIERMRNDLVGLNTSFIISRKNHYFGFGVSKSFRYHYRLANRLNEFSPVYNEFTDLELNNFISSINLNYGRKVLGLRNRGLYVDLEIRTYRIVDLFVTFDNYIISPSFKLYIK